MVRGLRTALLAVSAVCSEGGDWDCCPNMRRLMELAERDPEAAVSEIKASALHRERAPIAVPEATQPRNGWGDVTPIVVAHGFSDSCFTDFMRGVTDGAAAASGGYAVCIPTGATPTLDFLDSVLKDVDSSVDTFAARIRADPKLSKGFNAMGLSQGGLLVRAYIERYNDPPVLSFMSLHGIVMGVAEAPGCFHQGSAPDAVCRALAEVLGDLAYNEVMQRHLFIANDYRDPMKAAGPPRAAFLRHSRLARLNNEYALNRTYAENFGKVQRFVMIKADQDSMVYPNDSQWWGQFADGYPYTDMKILSMEETPQYQQNLFGLRAAHEAGKIEFLSTPDDHLIFSFEDLAGWIQTYFAPREGRAVVI